MDKQPNYRLLDRIESSNLLLGAFWDTLSYDSASPLLAEVREFEQNHPTGFNRFCDLSKIEGISLSTAEINRIASQRRIDYKGPQIRSAIYTLDQLSYGMMRIYAALMHPSHVEVMVFYEAAAAADWLGVPTAELARMRNN